MNGIAAQRPIGVVGAGTMGAGIVQLAAAAGHSVMLFDASGGAAENGKTRIADGLEKLVARGKMRTSDRSDVLQRIEIAHDLSQLSAAAMVVEAVVEDIDVKRRLFSDLEEIVAQDTVLATNTSSISITSIARDLKHPERVVGMHFFDPAPIMNWSRSYRASPQGERPRRRSLPTRQRSTRC
jgi:3-hydroxybutyryl-CoA dehydrogenase